VAQTWTRPKKNPGCYAESCMSTVIICSASLMYIGLYLMQKSITGNAASTSDRQMVSNIDVLLRSIRDPFAFV
jgi:hypothetical protein